MDINYNYTLEIDTNPTGVSNYAALGDGISNLQQSINEVLLQTSFLKNKGWGSTEVTGGQFILTLTGKRVHGDVAQDFIFSSAVQFAFGTARKTNLRLTDPNGMQFTVPVTLAKLNVTGGDANQGSDIDIEIHGNGQPTISQAGQVIGSLTVVSLAGASVSGNTQLYVNPAIGGGHSYKYKMGASVDIPAYGTALTTGWTAWNGTAEITGAVTGNVIVVAEVDGSNLALKAGKATATAHA